MRGTTRTIAVAGVSAFAMLTAACSGSSTETTSTTSGSGSNSSSSSEAPAAAGGEIVVHGCTPENPLIASNTSETCGGNILDTITAKLVHYNSETAEPEMDIAEDIKTDDNQNFTVTLKDYKFSDGTPVTSKSFVDAWNYAAYGPNGQGGSYFFGPIEGFADLQCTGTDEKTACEGEGAPKAKELTGLKVVDDKTFTIKTTEKVSNLPVRLGYTAFAPQPDAFFKDPEAFGKAPIGAGPFKFESWTEGQSIVVVKNADYSGANAGKLDKITFKIYQDTDAAYNDLLAGQIDVLDAIPVSALIDDKYKTDLGERNAQRETGVIQYIGMNPKADPSLAKPEIRKAISMAIDRDTINKAIFNNTRVPATGWVSPVVDGYQKDVCGEACVYDAAKAKAALDAAGGYSGKLTLTYNGDGDHKAWTEATCNSIKDALGIDCTATPTVDFKTFLTGLGKGEIKGLFRMGWQMDYPSIENFLAPIYTAGADSNYFNYNNPEFEKLLKEAAGADGLDAANAKYQEAEKVIAADMPTIPMYYGKATMGYSEKIGTFAITPFGVPDFSAITVK
ncbi:ABC transporter substrate-binding protein [Nostocoides veronense]|uniref:ABC transporter substrate-binding protein n=1 Tax=Nostocoides veronense TaxID=330836 RepID=A0ABN2LFA8_9MICO